jgi:hypothetical protein
VAVAVVSISMSLGVTASVQILSARFLD